MTVTEAVQCRLDLSASSRLRHLESQHGVYQSEVHEEEYLVNNPLVVYRGTDLLDREEILLPGPQVHRRGGF